MVADNLVGVEHGLFISGLATAAFKLCITCCCQVLREDPPRIYLQALED